MLFNSYIFVFFFLPVVLFGWHGLNHFGKYKLAQVFVILMSLWFYGYFRYQYLFIILSSIAVNWLISLGIERWMQLRKLLGVAGVVFNLGLLFYFKYYDFFIENVNLVFGTDWTLKNIVLPLGISFFTFQQISFVVDRMWGEAEHYKLVDYAMFVVYFPQLIAGPIVSHSDLVPQFWDKEKRRWDWNNVLNGIRLFVLGLAKKSLLADELGKLVDFGYSDVSAMDSLGAFFVILAWAFQIYFDFSAYSDMAIGLGRMMNLKLPINFDSPFQSHSIQETWRRWHITLGSFLRRYVYIPLGGSRDGKVKKMRNTMLMFLFSGIWHGANWTYILWGVINGIGVCIEDIVKRPAEKRKWAEWLGWFYTFGFFLLTVTIFRSDTVSDAWIIYKRLFSFEYTGYVWQLAASVVSYKNHVLYMVLDRLGGYTLTRWLYMIWMLFLLLFSAFMCTRKDVYTWVSERTASRREMWCLAFLFGLSVLTFSGIATFLYFNF